MADSPRKKPKLPAKQLAILAMARIAEPLAHTSVFPYLPEMIKSFGIPQNDVAKWAGVTSAVFSFAQSLTAVPWGRASDIFGRKPTIIIGLISTAICFIAWGMATSLPMAIIIRFIQGGGNGNVGIIRTMVAEMVPEKELQPRAFSIMPLVWSIGSIFGPAFGGFLAKPAERFPTIFGPIAFFNNYPFALPNLVGAVVFLISVTTATLFLKETLAHRRHHEDWGLLMGKRITRSLRRTRRRGWGSRRLRRTSFVDGEATAPLVPQRINTKKVIQHRKNYRPSMKEVFQPQSRLGLAAYTFLALHSVAYDQILPVFLNYPEVEHNPENTQLPFKFSGGLGMASNQIGTLFTVYGIACGLIQFILFPPLCSAIGALRCFQLCSLMFPFCYFFTPYIVLIEDTKLRLAALLVIMVWKAFCVIIGFPSITILLTNSCASLSILGTLNGFATTFSALGRGFGPAIAGACFSWGVKKGYVSVAWWFLLIMAVMGAFPAFYMVDGPGPSQDLEVSTDREGSGEEDGDVEGVLGRADSGIVVGQSDEDPFIVEEDDDDPYDEDEDGKPLLGRREEEDHRYGGTS